MFGFECWVNEWTLFKKNNHVNIYFYNMIAGLNADGAETMTKAETFYSLCAINNNPLMASERIILYRGKVVFQPFLT